MTVTIPASRSFRVALRMLWDSIRHPRTAVTFTLWEE